MLSNCEKHKSRHGETFEEIGAKTVLRTHVRGRVLGIHEFPS